MPGLGAQGVSPTFRRGGAGREKKRTNSAATAMLAKRVWIGTHEAEQHASKANPEENST